MRSIAAAVAVALLAVGSLAATAAATPSSQAGACSTVRLELWNPQAGDLLTPGSYVLQGIAQDSAAPDAPGIDRVQVFFDAPRESGGHFIGEVDAGQAAPDQYLTASGFSVVALIPDTAAQNDTHAMFAYARSASSGQEQVVNLTVQLKHPLNVGPLTPTPTPPPASLAVPPCSGPTPTPTFPPFPASLATQTPGPTHQTETLTLQVSNPQPGDSLASGTYLIGGLAFDSSAASGSTGVDHVQVFLDPRDDGGLFLGDATLGTASVGGVYGFQLVTKLPGRAGGHILSVYARSSVSGREVSVSIPITLH